MDTMLSIYTGTSLTNLTVVTENDQNGDTNYYYGDNSTAVFAATKGVTYQIAADGYYGSAGAVGLQVNLWTNGAMIVTPPTNTFVALNSHGHSFGGSQPSPHWPTNGLNTVTPINGATNSILNFACPEFRQR